MKTFLSLFVPAGLLGLVTQLKVNLPDLACFVAFAFTAALAGWMAAMYTRKFPRLGDNRPLHLHIPGHTDRVVMPAIQNKAA